MPQIKKRAPTAYNFLTKDKELREQIKREHPDWKNGDILSEYSRLWYPCQTTNEIKARTGTKQNDLGVSPGI